MQYQKKKKVNNSQHTVKEESFILFFIQVYETFQWNQTLHNLLFIFGQCQFIAFVWNPIIDSNIDDALNKFNYRIIINCVSRFDIILTHYFKMEELLFLIPLSCIIFFEIIPIGVFCIFKEKINQQITTHKLSGIYLTLCSLYSQIFNLYLFVPFMSMCLFQIFHNHNGDRMNSQIYTVVFSILTSVLLISSFLLRLLLCLESIDLKLDPHRQFNQTFIDLLIFATTIIQLLGYVVLDIESYGIMIQGIVIIFRSLLRVYQITSQMITCLKIVVQTTFIIFSYGVIESLLLISSNQNNNINDQITILITPLLAILFKHYFENIENSIFDNIMQVQDPEKIKYYFGKLINVCCSDQSQLLLLQSQMLKLAKDKCSVKVEEIKPFQILSMEPFPVQVMNRFHQKKLKKLLQTNPRAGQLNVIHYIAVLYQMGFHYLAYKQISMFSGKQKENQSSNSTIRVQTKISEFKGGRSISQGDRQSSSKDSKSQDLGEKLQQIEMQKKKLLLLSKSLISGIQQQKMIFLRQQIQMKLQFQFLQFNKNVAESSHLSLGVKLFLEGESRNQQLKDSLIKSLNKKMLFFQQFQAQKVLQSERLFALAMKLSARFYKIEQALLQLYRTFPSQKLQSVITFFYSELLNNFIEAYKLKNYTSISDEKLITMHKNVNTQFLSRNLVFLNVILDEENQQLLIAKASDNAAKFLLRTTEELKKITIDQLLPDGIVREHYLLVQRFMKNGQSKFFLRNNQSYFKVQNSIIKPFQLFFDIHFTANSQIRFYVFLQESSNQSSFIFIDVNENVGGFTENLFDKLGYSQSCIELFYQFDFGQVKLHQLFIKSSLILDADSESLLILDFQFPKESFFINDLNLKKNTLKSQFHLCDAFSEVDQLNKYELTLIVHKYEIYEYFYNILEVKEIKALSNSNKEFYENNFVNSNITEQEASVSAPKTMIVLNRFIIKDKVDFDEKINEIKNQQIENLHFKDDIQILSPNLSLSYTPNTSQMLIKKQQDFFNKQFQDVSQSFQDSKSNQINDDSNIRLNIQSHLAKNQNILDDNSQGSTHAGIKKAQFYKKYEAFDAFIQHQSPKSLKFFFFFNILSITLGIVFFIIVLVAATFDLGLFIEEIDMIQLHSGIMIPHDMQYGIRQTVVTYQAYLSAGAITKALYTNLSEPLIMSTNSAYLQFKENTLAYLSNRNLQPFFQDKYLNLVFMKSDATSVYTQNLTVLEGFMTMIHYYYMFKLRFEARISPANQTYQVFQFANVMNINFWLEDLTVQVWNYSKNRSIDTKTKWNVYWIIFLTLTVIFLILSVIYYRALKQKFDKYLNMFRYCTAHKVGRDIDRYKFMLRLLTVNSDLIFNYNFDLDQKEQSIQMEKIKYDQEQLKVKEVKAQSQFKQLNYFIGIVALLIYWVIYLVLSVIINEQTGSYLTEYYHTADLYKQIQDMTWSSSSLYRNRDFRLLWKNFTYLTTNDLNELYTYIYKGIENVDNFNNLCNSFDQNLYQTSSEFLEFFENIQSNSVCDVLGQDQLGFLFQYCNKSLEGTLSQGLLPTLGYMKKQIQTQMAINNFTKRVEYNLYENEGALIVMMAFQIMTTELKSGMVMILNNQLQVLNAISITYILLMVILIVYNLFYLMKKYLHDLFLARRFITLLPTITLFLDDQFERHMRILVNSQKQ